jgi:hypothetical protein
VNTKTDLNPIFDEWYALRDRHREACEEHNDFLRGYWNRDTYAQAQNTWRAMQQFTARLLSDEAVQEIDASCYADDTVSRKRPCIDPHTVELCTRALENNDPEARWELWCYHWPLEAEG